MRLDFYSLREALRKSILDGLDRSEVEFDPSVVAWAAYALIQEGSADGRVARLRAVLDKENSRWSQGEINGRDLIAIAALNLIEKTEKGNPEQSRLILQDGLKGLQAASKLSALRLPEQLFMIGVAMNDAELGARQNLATIIRAQMSGPAHRRVLLTAALLELGEKPEPPKDLSGDDVADVIARLWWQIRYSGGTDSVANWRDLDALLLTVDLGGTEDLMGIGRRVLGPWEKGLLFECLSRELREINPRTLFDIYPLNQRVKRIAQSHFEQGKFPSAITQAVQVLNELIQRKTGDKNLGEINLVNHYFGGVPPKFVLNDDYDDLAGRDDHNGITTMIRGVFTGLRNPRGHRPEDSPLLVNSAYEALDQLVLISYLMGRVEQARPYTTNVRAPATP